MRGQARGLFTVVKRSKRSRIETPHGVVETPGFVPVATNAALKAMDMATADALGCQLMFCNTYHLMLQPGAGTVEGVGGLHTFMNRRGPLITDSGGFQAFSLMAGALDLDSKVGLKGAGGKKRPSLVKRVDEEGITFQSYRDGTLMTLTPESSVRAQKQLGADIIVPLDYLIPYNASREEVEAALALSHRWEQRSLEAHLADPRGQAMYSVVHGGLHRDLRQQSVEFLAGLAFDGHAVGGSLGETRDDLIALLEFVLPQLPEDMPNHILGIADMDSILRAVPLGADTFDSCYPTRLARHGTALLGPGQKPLNVRRASCRHDPGPLQEGCPCATCASHSRAYIHHLFKAHEGTGPALVTVHNITCMLEFMRGLRQRILDGDI